MRRHDDNILLLLIAYIIAIAILVVAATPLEQESTEDPVLCGVASAERAEVVPDTLPESCEPEPDRVRFDVPLSDELQAFVINIGNYYGIEPELILAVIEVESSYQTDAVCGSCYGLMQVNSKAQDWRMASLECYDLFDPRDNISVGVDILSDCLQRYDGDITKALMAYNGGGAYCDKLISRGITNTAYTSKVLDAQMGIKKSALRNLP